MSARGRYVLRRVVFAVGYPFAIFCLIETLRPSKVASTPFLLWPVLVSLFLLGLFASSLREGPSMVEQFARRSRDELPPGAEAYCRKVTIAWCAFFSVNALVATVTVFYTPLWVWTLYNGCLSYIALGLLFAGEYFLRLRWKRTLGRQAA